MKYVREREGYLNNIKINEAASGDIEFGDSIVGRLLSGIFRMAKMGVDMKRVDGSLARLEKAINNYVTIEMQKEPDFKKASADIEKAGVVEGLVYKIKNDPKGFSKYLEALNKENPELMKEIMALPEMAEISQAVIDQEVEGTETPSKNITADYNTMIKNLKFLSTVLSTYTNVKLEGEKVKTEIARPSSEENLKKKTVSMLQQKTTTPAKQEPAKQPATTPAKQEVAKKNEAFGDQAKGADVTKEESHLTEAFGKLRKSIEALISSKEKGIGVDAAFINDILSKANDTKNKESIKALYVEINRYLVGDKKATLQQPDLLYKESIEVISDKNKMPIVAEKIARFAKRAMQFEGTGLYSSMGDCGKALEQFNITMKSLSTTKTNESINESFISDMFNVNVGKGDIKIEGDNNKITQIIYNGKNFDFDEFLKSKGLSTDPDSITKTTKDLERSLEGKATELVKEAQIDAIEIVRIFNQAGRLITKTNIPSTRSGGKISVARSNNWESLDGSAVDPQNPKGPVRNIKLFQRWNDGVLKLIKKYDDVLKNAKIKTSSGELVKPKYPISKFMVDCLEDGKLFKSMSGRGSSDDAGYQKKYLMEHLELDEATASKVGGTTDDKNKNKEYEFTINQKSTTVKGLASSVVRLSGKYTIDGDVKENISLYVLPFYKVKGDFIAYVSTADKYVKKFISGYTAENDTDSDIYLVKFSGDNQFGKATELTTKGITCCKADEIEGAKLIDLNLKITQVETLQSSTGTKAASRYNKAIDVKGFVYYEQPETISKLNAKLTKSTTNTAT